MLIVITWFLGQCFKTFKLECNFVPILVRTTDLIFKLNQEISSYTEKSSSLSYTHNFFLKVIL